MYPAAFMSRIRMTLDAGDLHDIFVKTCRKKDIYMSCLRVIEFGLLETPLLVHFYDNLAGK